MLTWKQNVKWEKLPLRNNITSFDRQNEVFLTITTDSYKDNEYIYNVCTVDHRAKDVPYKVRWHKKLKLVTVTKNHYIENYVVVCGRRLYVNAILKNLKKNNI